jgi:hypothetical protein
MADWRFALLLGLLIAAGSVVAALEWSDATMASPAQKQRLPWNHVPADSELILRLDLTEASPEAVRRAIDKVGNAGKPISQRLYKQQVQRARQNLEQYKTAWDRLRRGGARSITLVAAPDTTAQASGNAERPGTFLSVSACLLIRTRAAASSRKLETALRDVVKPVTNELNIRVENWSLTRLSKHWFTTSCISDTKDNERDTLSKKRRVKFESAIKKSEGAALSLVCAPDTATRHFLDRNTGRLDGSLRDSIAAVVQKGFKTAMRVRVEAYLTENPHIISTLVFGDQSLAETHTQRLRDVRLTTQRDGAKVKTRAGPRGLAQGFNAAHVDLSEYGQALSLISETQTLRSQIDLYRVQHDFEYPSLSSEDGWQRLTDRTDSKGAVLDRKRDGQDAYGPYLMEKPVNPFTDSSRVSGSPDANGKVSGAVGWAWRGGQLKACVPRDVAERTGLLENSPQLIAIFRAGE